MADLLIQDVKSSGSYIMLHIHLTWVFYWIQDYEMDALNNLKKILSGKWDFVTMQGEEQVNMNNSYKRVLSWCRMPPPPIVWSRKEGGKSFFFLLSQ